VVGANLSERLVAGVSCDGQAPGVPVFDLLGPSVHWPCGAPAAADVVPANPQQSEEAAMAGIDLCVG